jgi:hypothetical protein
MADARPQGRWRPVVGDPVFQPGLSYHINPTTGQRWVFEPADDAAVEHAEAERSINPAQPAAVEDDGGPPSLVDFINHRQWVAWRNEQRGDKLTKVPYTAVGQRAKSDDPSTWLRHDEAVLIAEAIDNGLGGGVGIMLGQCGDRRIAGIDLDTCRDPVTGEIASWAQAIIDRMATYAEASPSGTGVKLFPLVDPAAEPELRRLLGRKHGKTWKRPNGKQHPPAIELHIDRRFFAVTWECLPNSPSELRTVSLEDLRWLIEQAGPAFAGKAEGASPGQTEETSTTQPGADPASLARLDAAARSDQAIATALRNAATMCGGSRSEGAMGVGAALKRAGWSYADMKAALLACPATKEWAQEQRFDDDRQFQRIWERANDGNTGTSSASGAARLECIALEPVPKDQLPPRQWAYGTFLLFGTAGVIAAVDGGGKGALAVVMIIEIITGKSLLGEHIWRTGPVGIIAYEDDLVEWQRRIAAACAHYGIDYATVTTNIRFIQRPGGRVSFANTVNNMVTFPDGDEIIRVLRDMGAALLVIDPFNHAHGLDDGNNNVLIAKVAGEMTRIAQESNTAVLVLHHLRKGATGQPDDLMGATALRATFRSARILMRMTTEEAKQRKLAESWRYIRIASSKENYAPPPDQQRWFRLDSVALNNGTERYPAGDNVAVATVYEARPLFEGMDSNTLAAVFAALRQSIYSPSKQAKNWAGEVLITIGGRSEDEAKRIVSAWLDNGVLTRGKYYAKGQRHDVYRVVLDEGKVAEILAHQGYYGGPDGPDTCA